MRRKRDNEFPDNGFEQWGGYMNAKITKLEEQYADKASKETNKNSDLFKGISIFVNGYTKPSADQLKCIMSEHGGVYHHYFRSNKTNFIIASNLPDTKVKNLPSTKIVKPEWISDSVEAGHLLDYKDYLLHSNISKTQPRLNFNTVKKNKSNSIPEGVSNQNARTATDPRFLSEFYKNSRLHHISQLAGTFKQYVNDLRSGNDFTFPHRDAIRNNLSKCEAVQDDQSVRVIMHIDMDCFFVSVGLRKHPHLRGKPVAVTHAKSTKGVERRSTRIGVNRKLEFEMYRQKKKKNIITNCEINDDEEYSSVIETKDDEEFSSMSEIASCSYEARAKGLHNGMFMGTALKLCPELKTIPYDFDDYKDVAFMLYDTVAQYTLDIEAVSCDEMYVDCTELIRDVELTPLEFASFLRAEIRQKTQCPCSTGFGENRLQARLATKKAKPDGQFYMNSNSAEEFFTNVSLSDLPGVGRQMNYKLKNLGYSTCGSLRSVQLKVLQKHFGNKTGQMLFDYCRGNDSRPLNFNSIRKSISAGANYGIRFTQFAQCEEFLTQLCRELQSRMIHCNVRGRAITLKLMVRAVDAPTETAKFMGHGICDNVTRTQNMPDATDDLETITREVIKLCCRMNVKPEDMRGIGVQISKLEDINRVGDTNKSGGIQRYFGESSNRNVECETAAEVRNEDRVSTVEESGSEKQTQVVIVKDAQPTVKKRGRPPKNKSLINASKKEPSNFFSSNNKKIVSNKNMPDIDIEVFNELPDDIKQEIMSAYNITDVNALSIKNEIAEAEIHEDPTSDSQQIREAENESSLDILGLNWKDIRTMIKHWMKSDAVPLQCDIDVIKTYLGNQVMIKKLEDVFYLMNFLHRTITELKRCDWHKVYEQAAESVQESMIDVYGKKLLIKKIDCRFDHSTY